MQDQLGLSPIVRTRFKKYLFIQVQFYRFFARDYFLYSGLDESVLTMSPSEQHLSRLAYQLNIQSCRELIINLGIQLNDWEDIEYSYTRMPLIIKIMALNFWKTKNIVGRPNKSFNNLLDALKAVGDTRHLLCKV